MYLSELFILHTVFLCIISCHRNRDFRLLQDSAMLHVDWMSSEGACNLPKPQIIYPPTSAIKLYYPRGTILYRCNDQTGCCLNSAETCGPIETQQIEVTFFVTYVNDHHKLSSQRRRGQTLITEIRKMTNHTKCSCKKRMNTIVEHDDIQEVVSRPLITQHSKTVNILLVFMSLFSVIVIIIGFVFLLKKCREVHSVVAAY